MRSLKQFAASMMAVAIIFSAFPAAFAVPDEGMYAPDQIAKLPLKKRGLKIKPSDVYNPAGVDISDAVISLSIGCTAEFVSPKGLILTNHHCGFDALVSASTADKDFGKDGFKAESMATEMPAKDYALTITNRVEDVTARVTAGTDTLTGEALTAALNKNVAKVQSEEQAKAAEGMTIRIQPLNNGMFYYLYETSQLLDIRVVYAPPQMIGFYGGDPDNFEWSRHTGDFTFLRAYVGKDGKPAPYSKDNVPYTPKKHLTISLDGLKDNDFVFVLGFPGGTTRYRESQDVEYAQNVNFPFLVSFLTSWGDALRLVGANDEAKRVALQGEVASIDNGRKAYEGAVVALKRSGFAAQRKAEETRFASWVAQDPARQAKYGNVLADLDKLSKGYYTTAARDRLLRTFPSPAYAPVYKQFLDAVSAVRAGRKLDDKKRAEIEATMKEREPVLETEMLKYFLRAAADLPSNQKFAGAEKQFGNLSGGARRAAETKFAESIANSAEIGSAEQIIALYGKSIDQLKAMNPALADFALAHADERAEFGKRAAAFNGGISAARLLYQKGLAEMRNTLVYPDANFTMRFTYGNVKGYNPREAVSYSPFTTLKGVIEKDTGVFPFDVPAKLKELQNARDFGRFGVGDSVPVNFLSTNDIIGGNSGSPIMNGNGEQVGIVFDGNFEGLGNDYFYDGSYGRTISVDIRYVLFVTEKFGGAGWLLNEMTLKGGKKK